MKFKFILICSALSLFFVSCGKNSTEKTSLRANSFKKMGLSQNVALDSISYEDSFVGAEESVPMLSSQNDAPQTEKKLIKTGNINLEIENLSESIVKVEEWISSYGGYISNSSNSEKNAWFNIKIPSSKFDDAMNSACSLGKVLNHSENTEDVSEQYYDLASRLQNKKTMKSKLEGYLSNAKDIKDLLEIERELNSVISDIDSMEGRLKRLSNQVEYSTITINLQLPSNHSENGFIFPDLKNGFSNFLSNFLNFLIGFVKVFFLVILCGIPILAAIAFFYWLLFGRIGLILKLYKWLKKQK